jgi:uncharacterized protein
MIVDIRDFDESGGHLSAVDAATVVDPVAGEVRVPCMVEVDYRPSGSGFQLHGVVEGTLPTVCHRCLEPVRHAVRGDFDLMVRRGDPAGEDWDDTIVLPAHHYEVVLDPFINETIVVNTPMIVLCQEACRGLCPACGVDLNRETCACEAPADGRWDGLKKLK